MKNNYQKRQKSVQQLSSRQWHPTWFTHFNHSFPNFLQFPKKIKALPKQIKFTAYADDFHLIIEHNRSKNTIVDLSSHFQEIGH